MDPVLARKQHRTLEPYHGMIYFVPEAAEAYAEVGVHGRGGYFASRAAPMGPVPAEVVVATFYNFCPTLVHDAMAGVWDATTPAALLAARRSAADAALRRVLGEAELASPATAEAAELAETAAGGCTAPGRPLYAAHAGLERPEEPHLRLWHAITLLREFRGDGHLAALLLAGLDGCEALVLHGASGEVPVALLQATRAWPDEEWAAATQRLADRGWVDGDGALTEAGREAREGYESRTDEADLAPWRALGQEGADRLRALVRPWSKALVASGTFGLAP